MIRKGVRTIAAYDWSKIKAEYISSSISLRDLAEKYGVSFSTLSKRAKREAWTKERDKTSGIIATKVIQKATTKIANRVANGLDKEYAIADKLADVLARALSDDQQFNRYLVKTKVKSPLMDMEKVVERQFDKLDMQAIANAVKSLQGVESVKRRIKGILTEPERQRNEIDREKLELEKRKADTPIGDNTQSGVVELASVLPEEPDGDDE